MSQPEITTKNIELVEAFCLRCNMVHVAKKENCKQYGPSGKWYAKVFCTGNPCDGMNGKIWHLMHGPDRYVTGEVLDYEHPIKRTIITSFK